jgi:hypothetical protein
METIHLKLSSDHITAMKAKKRIQKNSGVAEISMPETA